MERAKRLKIMLIVALMLGAAGYGFTQPGQEDDHKKHFSFQDISGLLSGLQSMPGIPGMQQIMSAVGPIMNLVKSSNLLQGIGL